MLPISNSGKYFEINNYFLIADNNELTNFFKNNVDQNHASKIMNQEHYQLILSNSHAGYFSALLSHGKKNRNGLVFFSKI